MRRLLSSRVLKRPPCSERFSKFLFRYPKSLKRLKRTSFSRPKSLSEVHPSPKVAAKARKGVDDVECLEKTSGIETSGSSELVVRSSVEAAEEGREDVEDMEGLGYTDNIQAICNLEPEAPSPAEAALKVTNGVEGMEGPRCSSNIDASGSLEPEFHSLAEAATKGGEVVQDATGMEGLGYTNNVEANGSLEQHENNGHLQEEDNGLISPDLPKGPIIPPGWKAVMSAVAEMPSAVCLICGGKNTGKSTFARYLVNSLLNRWEKVGFLDTDVGQPEFTPSGCLSLHVLDEPIVGLPALEMKDPKRCYFFGDTSPKCNPEDYLKSVFSLYDHFKCNYTLNHCESKVGMLEKLGFPLIINTHGWIQGVGLYVLIKIINYIAPTHIVQTVSKASNKNLPPNRFWESNPTTPPSPQLLFIQNALENCMHLAEIKYEAWKLRELRLLAYFQRSIIDNFMQTPSKRYFLFLKTTIALASCKPFQVPISAINIVQQHCQVPAGELMYSLNATLVGLGVSDEKEQHSKPLCVGLGIVRAVDVWRGLYYVITPLKLEVLQRVDSFIQGRMEIPVSFLKLGRFRSPYVSENTLSIEGTGSVVMGKGKKKVLRMLRSQ